MTFVHDKILPTEYPDKSAVFDSGEMKSQPKSLNLSVSDFFRNFPTIKYLVHESCD